MWTVFLSSDSYCRSLDQKAENNNVQNDLFTLVQATIKTSVPFQKFPPFFEYLRLKRFLASPCFRDELNSQERASAEKRITKCVNTLGWLWLWNNGRDES